MFGRSGSNQHGQGANLLEKQELRNPDHQEEEVPRNRQWWVTYQEQHGTTKVSSCMGSEVDFRFQYTILHSSHSSFLCPSQNLHIFSNYATFFALVISCQETYCIL